MEDHRKSVLYMFESTVHKTFSTAKKINKTKICSPVNKIMKKKQRAEMNKKNKNKFPYRNWKLKLP